MKVKLLIGIGVALGTIVANVLHGVRVEKEVLEANRKTSKNIINNALEEIERMEEELDNQEFKDKNAQVVDSLQERLTNIESAKEIRVSKLLEIVAGLMSGVRGRYYDIKVDMVEEAGA